MTAALLLLLATASPSSADMRIAEAERLARAGENAAARTALAALLEDGRDGASVRYNLGTLALEAGELGEAVLQLKAALRRDPSHDDARYNLALALEASVDRFEGADEAVPLGASLPPEATRLAAAAGMAVVGLLLGLHAFAAGRARARLARGLVAAVAGMMVSWALLGLRWSYEQTPEFVVMAPATAARKEPDPKGRVAFEVHAGASGVRIGEEGGFLRLRFPNGLEAWVTQDEVAAVP